MFSDQENLLLLCYIMLFLLKSDTSSYIMFSDQENLLAFMI